MDQNPMDVASRSLKVATRVSVATRKSALMAMKSPH